MKLLLDDALAPVTSEFGFVESEPAKVADWFRQWDESNQVGRGVGVNRRVVTGTLPELLRSLEPLTSVERRRTLFMATQGPWTAYFDNGWRGGDAAMLSEVALELGCRALRVVAVPDSMGVKAPKLKKGRYGATMLEVFGPAQTAFLNYVRSIVSSNDGDRWVFEQSGEPMPFEDLAAYRARSVRDRFTPVLLDRYLKALGVRAFEEDFYAPERTAFLVEREGPVAADLEEYSIADVQSRWRDSSRS